MTSASVYLPIIMILWICLILNSNDYFIIRYIASLNCYSFPLNHIAFVSVMSPLTYYLKVCDIELLQDLLGVEWRDNLTVEHIMHIKNKISPFMFCEIVLLWVLDLKPCSAVISLMIDEMLSFRLSYLFYLDIASEMFKMGYLRQRHIFNRLKSIGNFKYNRQSWSITTSQLQDLSDMKPIKLIQNCNVQGCKIDNFHSVFVKLEPVFDNKIRLIRDKLLSLNNEHRHEDYCHWYFTLNNSDQREETLFLTTAKFDNIVGALRRSLNAKLFCYFRSE